MLCTEYLNDGTLIKHYSDGGFYILQHETGVMYMEAVDIVPCPYTYTETDITENTEDEDETADPDTAV